MRDPDRTQSAHAFFDPTEQKGTSLIDKIFQEHPHRRWNPLKREWVIVSPHRTDRPWQGQTESTTEGLSLAYDPACYLCPGNVRAGGQKTPEYSGTFVFENDFAALTPDAPAAILDVEGVGLIRAETERGICRVLCFDARHDLTLASMDRSAIRRVVELWAEQAAELGARTEIEYVQIFENRGAMMGCSNPHPHGQIWATQHIPNEPSLELSAQRAYLAEHGQPLLSTYLRFELEQSTRVVAENETWAALVPFWAVWPFELLLLPKQGVARVEDFTDHQREGLSAMLQQVTRGYDRVFETAFPYSMGVHPAPADGQPHPEWLLHVHFYPPLLRSASVRKFMVGFELLGSPQRDITPEAAAAILSNATASASSGKKQSHPTFG